MSRYGQVVDHLQDTGVHPLGRVGEDADGGRDAIRGLETDATDVQRETIRLARDDVHRAGAVAAYDPGRQRGAGSVGLQEDHHIPERPLLAPRLGQSRASLLTETFDFAESTGLFVQDT